MNLNRTSSSRTTTVILTAVSAMLAVALSGCAVTLSDPGATNSPVQSPAPTPSTDDESDGTTNGGAFTQGDCDGRDVEIADDGVNAVLSGRCGVVNITGTGTTVAIVDADSVIVTGTDNVVISEGETGAVTLKGDRNSYTGGSVGSITVESNDNTAILSAADDVRLSGDANFVQWSAGVASAEDTGSGNVVVAASAE